MFEERDSLLQEHQRLLDLGKFYYDALFKFASISFVLNGALLSALAFVVKDVANPTSEILLKAVCLIGWIGIIYNFGIAFAFVSLALTAWKLTIRFRTVDAKLHFHIADCKPRFDLWGALGWLSTAIFVFLWIAVWRLLIIYKVDLLTSFFHKV
jgi:hypothetical protein